ncbi:MAG: BspA family leucine-rich repeat surface protein [Bacteroidaceae bacterium]|nr:BspA family leucine-rich repeat surface protein [Bacteroidaceae bacterium]
MKKLILFALLLLAAGLQSMKAQEAYACYTSSDMTLTFYYDNLRSSRTSTTYDLNTGSNKPGWYTDGNYANVTKVVFNSSFANARPTSTYGWFNEMENLQSVTGMAYLNTSEVTDMQWMFYLCTGLTSLDLSNFNTTKVTDVSCMFSYCYGLTSLDLSNFNTANVTDMFWLFFNCKNLKTIYVGDGWSTAAVTDSESMFLNCTKLVGGRGTTYDSNHVDEAYAHIDGGTSNPGYFTDINEAYACYTSSNTTLTFYYDKYRSSRSGTTYDMPSGSYFPAWITDDIKANATKVVFDPSFAGFRPTTTYGWFNEMKYLQSVSGMAYLNTNYVTRMDYMFNECYRLPSLDLSKFNTANVTNMQFIFNCCYSLVSLDLSSFNTKKVTNMYYMFGACNNLETIYVGNGWNTAAVTDSEDMFYNCTSLVGGQGTTYNAEHVDASYAHVDGGTINPGYFTALCNYDFEVDGIWYKDVGYGCLAVTYKDENYFSYSGDVVIPESVTTDVWCYTVSTIGERAFYRCPYLQNLTIPASVDRIEVEAFYDAFFDAINSTVTCLAQTPPSISPMSFDYAIESMTLYVPVGTMTAYRSHSVWGQFASIVELPYSFVVNGIYYKITGDGTVSVTYRDANYNCYSGNVVIPATVKSDGVTYTVTAIEASAFFNCANLTDVTIPETVTQIGFNAFQGCTALEEGNITCLATTPPTIQSNTFGTWHYKGASLYVPYGCYDAYASANYWKNFSDIYELEEFIEYSLWIAGTRVTSWNKGNVLGDGHVSYDAGTNTLTLNGADISSESDYGIKSQLAGLNINVQGQNTVTAVSEDGIYLHATGTATIYGSGSLTVSTQDGVGIHAYQNLVLKDGVKVTVNSKSSYGVRGTKLKRTSPLPTLTMQGQETMLTAKGGNTSSSVAFFHALTLSDGLEILEPEGAEFLEDVGIVNSGGTVATFSKVVIGYPALLEPEAYACYTEENTTLTFYYDTERSSRTGTTYDLNTSNDIPAWYNDGTNASVTKAVFDASFANALLTSTYAWFAGMVNLQSITGMEYLNTSEVTSMGYMFYYCPSLTSLDLSHFDTSKVTGMYAMFYYCPSLTSLDLSRFNTANVTYMHYMFFYCTNLKTIYVGEGWSTAAVTDSEYMFYACESLVGGQGTVVDENHTDASYAHIDGGTSNPGYFTAEGAEPWSGPEAYACYTSGNTTLTFYYDNQRDSRTGTTYSLNMGSYVPSWYNGDTNASVTKVVFDASFANVRPTSTCGWFDGMENLQSIAGMVEYLNTSEVKYMGYMFAGCTSLTSLDISHFNTDKVTKMDGMFYNCEKFTSLNLSHFNTSNVTDMSGMFSGCESLTSLDVSNFNTGKVTNMSYMFRDCKLVTNLDVSSFNTENITSMESMFNDCDALTSLDLSNFNTGKVTNMSTMFWSCNNLTSVDLSSFNTSNVTNMSMMFADCQALKNLNLSNFNTANVTKMNRMFDSCIGLTSLDLSSFNTAKVTNMNWMFFNCCYLETIYVGDDWSTAAVTDSENMFTYCTSLVGGQGTTYDENHVDASYAHIDGGTSNPGYFTESATYQLWIAGTQVNTANMDNVRGDGTVSYNPETNTLTLNNANISANGTYGIRSVSPNININLIGRNNVEVVDGQGVSTTNRDGGTVTISGGGELNIKASDVAFATNCEVVFQDGVQIKAESTGSFGMEGSKARAARFYPAIKMLGSETVLMAKGGTGAITHFRILNLNNGIKILEPAGTTFVSNDGILITNEWVVIANQDYIDGIENVNANVNLNDSWYDLQGRKLDKITQPGIYIKDGKKIIRK